MSNLQRTFNFISRAAHAGVMVLISAMSGLAVSAATGGNVAAGVIAAFSTPFIVCSILDAKSAANKKQSEGHAPKPMSARPQ